MKISAQKIREVRGGEGGTTFAFRVSQLLDRPIGVNTLYAWERGTTRLTADQLAALVALTGRPFEFFYVEGGEQE